MTNRILLAFGWLLLSSTTLFAQTTAFTYQGKLADTNGLSPNYDFQFKLYDALMDGNPLPIGSPVTVTKSGVLVTNGVFSVNIDFGVCATCFDGSLRFLEISVRPTGGGSFTPLTPRQPITSTPYAVKSVNAATADGLSVACVSCVTSSQIATVNGSAVTGAIPVGSVPAGSANYIQNTTSPQSGNFNVSGNGVIGGSLGIGGISPGSILNLTGGAIVRARINSTSNGGVSFALNDQPRWSIATVTGGDLQIYNDATNQLAMSVNGTDSSVTVNTSISGNGAVKWQTVSGLTQQAQPNNGYLASNNAQVTVTLPTTPNIGDIVRVSGAGSGGWQIAQNAGQSVRGATLNLIGANWTPHESSRNWHSVASSADGTKLVAVVSGGQIYTSTDSGVTWTPRESNRNWWSVASSANGTKLVAVVLSGQIYTSTDSGVSWTPRDSSRDWVSVASSADGTKLVAVVLGLQIYTSTDSGVSWTPRESNRSWNSIASSADGTKLVAVVSGGGLIFTSTDSGITWTSRDSNRQWISVASSADGTNLVALVNFGQIFTSNDSGVSWIPRDSSRFWDSVASSVDGTKLVAVVQNGQIYISTDSGVTWTPRESNRDWWSVTSSADGTKLVAVVNGGQIYTSTPIFSTTIGTTGYVTGGQFTTIELQYIGNGQFLQLSHEGTIQVQ